MNEGMIYSNALGTADMTRAAYPTVPTRFVGSPAALVDSLNTSGGSTVPCAVFEEFGPDNGTDSPLRGVFGMTINGTAGQTMEEADSFVFKSHLDGKEALEIVPVASVVHTAGSNAVPANVGGRGNGTHKDVASVQITDNGLLLKLTLKGLEKKGFEPDAVLYYDVAECLGVLRVFKVGTTNPATGGAPIRRRWR